MEIQIREIIEDVNCRVVLDHPVAVHSILDEEKIKPCTIYKGDHAVIDCKYISRSNISPVILRKAAQWRLKLKNQEMEKEAKANMTM